MRITTTMLALAATALFATGCHDSNAPTASDMGRYGLQSLNGQPLPLKIIDEPALTVTLTQGALTLNANSTFTQDVALAVAAEGYPNASQSVSCSGTYSRSGNDFTLTGTETAECSAMTATGVLDGRTFTVSDDQGETLVFRR